MIPARSNPALWAIAVFTGLGAVLSLIDLASQVPASPQAGAVGALLTALLVAVFAWLVHRTGLWEHHGVVVACAFIWGAFATNLFVLLAQEPAGALATSLGLSQFKSALAGAWPEEIAKDLGVFLILLAWSSQLRRTRDGLVVGMFCGLGFELVETLGYGFEGALAHPSSDLFGALSTWQIRELFIGAGLHVICTGLAGWGMARALLAGRLLEGAAWPVGAFALHFVWNTNWPEAWELPILSVVYALGLGTLAWCWRCARRDHVQQPSAREGESSPASAGARQSSFTPTTA